jgi:hypothetical protein
MSIRQPRAAVTREHLGHAGRRPAEHNGLVGMIVNHIVEQAGVAKGRSSTTSPDRAGLATQIGGSGTRLAFASRPHSAIGVKRRRSSPGVSMRCRRACCLLDQGLSTWGPITQRDPDLYAGASLPIRHHLSVRALDGRAERRAASYGLWMPMIWSASSRAHAAGCASGRVAPAASVPSMSSRSWLAACAGCGWLSLRSSSSRSCRTRSR